MSTAAKAQVTANVPRKRGEFRPGDIARIGEKHVPAVSKVYGSAVHGTQVLVHTKAPMAYGRKAYFCQLPGREDTVIFFADTLELVEPKSVRAPWKVER